MFLSEQGKSHIQTPYHALIVVMFMQMVNAGMNMITILGMRPSITTRFSLFVQHAMQSAITAKRIRPTAEKAMNLLLKIQLSGKMVHVTAANAKETVIATGEMPPFGEIIEKIKSLEI